MFPNMLRDPWIQGRTDALPDMSARKFRAGMRNEIRKEYEIQAVNVDAMDGGQG
jgi:hypothetical protein